MGAPQARLAGLASGLRARGVDVRVHTAFPHYPDGVVQPPYRNRLAQRDRSAGVVRSAVYAAPNRGFARRLANHLSFAASALATSPLTGPADVVVVESPPLFLAAAGVTYAWAKRAALVVNVADRWPASAVELGALTDPGAIRAARALERWCYRHAAAVTVPTRGLVDDLQTLPEAAGKVERIPPAVDVERFAPTPPRPDRDGPLRVVYAGTVGLAQGLETLVEAAVRAGPGTVQVRVAGSGAEAPSVRAAVERTGAGNVELLGVVPAAGIPALYAWADAGAVLLRDRPIFAGALPTKLLEIMAAGRAVVLCARGEAAVLVAGAGAGVVVPPQDPGALAEALLALHRDRKHVRALGAAGRHTVKQSFERQRAIVSWHELLGTVISPGWQHEARGLS
ncbi:MAG: glycosyltransferase family 4 protein [Solirubrobacteraceae bacterium MAG38_C4-C5]|nr:glycosyltransferase family 4 protein [Candidatus Siliceabacter maunaloa]